MHKKDLIIIGGGLSGCAAALAAARQGLSVTLIEKGNALGGAPANNLVIPYMPYWTVKNGEIKYLSQGYFTEINDKLVQLNAYDGKSIFNEEFLKIVLEDLLLKENVDIRYHALLVGAKSDDGKVTSVQIADKSGINELSAKYFIDASGDAALTAFAGFDFQLGREDDNLCQPMTLCFRLAGVDTDNLDRKQVNLKYKEFKSSGKINNPREDVLIFSTLVDGMVHLNTTRVVKLNPTDPTDFSNAEMIARKQILEIYLFLKNNIEAFKNCQLISSASEIGVRESRMIKGEYCLTGEELKNCPMFEDSIALGNYDMDIHNPEGEGTSHYFFKQGEYYSIPYRCLIPKDSKNLLVAGRCISVDHYAQASIRIMPIVCTLGQAAGTAISIACNENIGVKEISIDKLHERLTSCGAIYE